MRFSPVACRFWWGCDAGYVKRDFLSGRNLFLSTFSFKQFSSFCSIIIIWVCFILVETLPTCSVLRNPFKTEHATRSTEISLNSDETYPCHLRSSRLSLVHLS